jgi:hypothetical protein
MFIDGLSNLRGAVKPGEQTRLACRRPAAAKRVDFCAEGNGWGSQRCSRTAALAAWSSFSDLVGVSIPRRGSDETAPAAFRRRFSVEHIDNLAHTSRRANLDLGGDQLADMFGIQTALGITIESHGQF